MQPEPYKAYTRREIHELVGGGSTESYLPTSNKIVLCGCFCPKKNPRAPYEIDFGHGPQISKNAFSLLDQKRAIPIFLREKPGSWVYVGDYRAVNIRTDLENLNRSDLADDRLGVLYLSPVNDIQPHANWEEEINLTGIEGKRKLITHFKKERRPALSQTKKRVARKELGFLQCESCGLTSKSFPNSVQEACFEVHHLNPIGERMDEKVTYLNDLAILCANCHRMIHRTSPMMSVKEFKELITR